MTPLEQQISDIQKSHKTLTIVIIIVVILGVGIYIFEKFYGHSASIMFSDDKALRTQIDSMIVHDRHRDTLYNQLQVIHTRDSMRIDDIQDQLDGTNAMIDKINNIYDKKRTQLTNSSLDDKLQFLSGHLPKSGNSR